MISIILAVVLAALIWYKSVKPYDHFKNMGVPQTNPWPILGDAWLSLLRKKSLCELVEYMYNMYPNSRYSGFYQFTKPVLVLKDLELIKQITVKDFDHFTDHSSFIDSEADRLWAGNLFALKGQKWREMRATLSGAFTSSKMKNIFYLMEETAESFVEHFLNQNKDVIEVEMKDTFTRYTNDVIASAAFGIKCNSLDDPDNEFYQMGREVSNLNGVLGTLKVFGFLLMPKILKALKVPFIPTTQGKYFTSIINETIKTREEKGIVRPDMINLLLETRKGVKHEEYEAIETGFATVKEFSDIGKFKQIRNLSNEDITSQALIFFFAGFDTISTAMCFGSYELVANKEVQDRLRKEIKETYKKSNGEVTYDILLKMKYMDMVVSEMLRKWAPAPVMDRCCNKPYTIEPVNPGEKPVHLRVGDFVWLPMHGIHRDPQYYPNPKRFDPERFSDENKDSIKSGTFIPFGSGPRNCIGSRFALLEIKALFFNLLLNFEIVPTEKTQIPLKLNRKTIQHTAEGGFWFGLKRVSNETTDKN